MSQMLATHRKRFQRFSTVRNKSCDMAATKGMLGGMSSARWKTYPARWRASCVANAFIEHELTGLTTKFRAKIINFRFDEEPTWLSHANLAFLGKLMLDRSGLFWGEGANEKPEHQQLAAEVRDGIQAIEFRIRENEAIRAHLLRQACPATADPPGPKPGAVSGKVRIREIANEILRGANRPPAGRGFRTRLAEKVTGRAFAEGLQYRQPSIERMLRDMKISSDPT